MIYRLDPNYYVRPLSLSDIHGPYPSWFLDQEVCRYNSHGKLFSSEAALTSYIDSTSTRGDLVWAICHNDDGHIGNIALQTINWINRTAEFAILMGNREHWGKGAASLAALQLLEHGFNKLNINRVFCGTAMTNIPMQKLAKKLGMKQEGIRRQHLFLEGQYVDLIEFGILKQEFINDRGL